MENVTTSRLIKVLPRGLFLDLFDMAIAKAQEAHTLIAEGTELSGKSARGAEGQIRFRIMEHGFQKICEAHGGVLLHGNCLAGDAGLRFYQPFMRFGPSNEGVVLGLASISGKRELPQKNQSRKAGVGLNFHLTPRLPLDEQDPQPGDIFVLFLTARDPSKPGCIEEVAVGLIDSKYESYIFYEPIETFMARYAQPEGTDKKSTTSLVKLKKSSKTYRPPEDEGEEKQDKKPE